MTDAEKSQAIKRHLAVLGLKQKKDVADILGVTRVTVSNLINQPRFGKKTAYAWHSAFGFSVDFLVNGTGPVLSSDAVREPGSITQNITGNSGINRMTLTKLLASPEDGTAEVAVKASWLAAICLRYHVSPAFLLLGSGPMFCGEGCPLNRRGQ